MAHKPYFHVSDKHTGELAHKRSEHTHTFIHTYIHTYIHPYILTNMCLFKLFRKLLDRRTPIVMVRIILFLYSKQTVCVK